MVDPITPDELERLRATVDGPACCPSCGEDVPPEIDICMCDPACAGDGVTPEPISTEFLGLVPFVSRDTARRLIARIDQLTPS